MDTMSYLRAQAIPGLHQSPSIQDLRDSIKAYNSLPDDNKQPNVSEYHLQNLATLFVKYNVEEIFGLHLIHGHLSLPQDEFMLGRTINDLPGCWTKPTAFSDVNLKEIHGHIFMLVDDDKLVAYEYRDGAPIDISAVNSSFFLDFIKYLKLHRLNKLLGLQSLNGMPAINMNEFVIGHTGTVMLADEMINKSGVYRYTGWSIEEKDGQSPFVVRDAHAKTTKGTHRVFVSKNPEDIEELRNILVNEDILK